MPKTTQCVDPTREALRNEIADRMLAQRQILLARIRRRLDARTGTQSEPDDVFSTTLRRVDALAASGELVTRISDEHLLGLATAIAQNAMRERVRRSGREQARLRAIGDRLHGTAGTDAATDAESALMLVEQSDIDRTQAERLLSKLLPTDLEILGLRLRGADWSTIAAELRTTPGAAHRRYFRALRKLAFLGGDGTPSDTAAETPDCPTAEPVPGDSPGSLP